MLPELSCGAAREADPREQHPPVVVRPGDDRLARPEAVRCKGLADVFGISNCEVLAVAPAERALAPGDLLAWRAIG